MLPSGWKHHGQVAEWYCLQISRRRVRTLGIRLSFCWRSASLTFSWITTVLMRVEARIICQDGIHRISPRVFLVSWHSVIMIARGRHQATRARQFSPDWVDVVTSVVARCFPRSVCSLACARSCGTAFRLLVVMRTRTLDVVELPCGISVQQVPGTLEARRHTAP